MKYPVSLRVLAVVQLVLSIVLGIILIILLVRQDAYSRLSYTEALNVALATGTALWFLLVSGLWLFGSAAGFGVLLANSLFVLFFEAYLIYSAIREFLSSVTYVGLREVLSVSISLATILFIFNIALLFSKAVRQLGKDFGSWGRYLPFAFGFLVSTFLPLAFVWGLQNLRGERPVYGYIEYSSGDMGAYAANNMLDNDPQTWWTPANHSGRESRFTIQFIPGQVTAIDILPGSHYPNYPKYGNLFKKNSRLKRAQIRMDSGDHARGTSSGAVWSQWERIDLKDSDEVQRIRISAQYAIGMEVQILETAPGAAWNDLCISEFRPVVRNGYFRDN